MTIVNICLYRVVLYTEVQYFEQLYFQYIYCGLSSIGFHLAILLGILDILIVLLRYFLYLILAKRAEYLPFCSVYKQMDTLFCLHLVRVYLK